MNHDSAKLRKREGKSGPFVPSGLRRFGLSRFILAIALWLASDSADAGDWPRFALPFATVKNKTGLQIFVDSDGLDGNGYRPIRVEVRTTPLAPLPADRQIRVVFKPRSYSSVKSPQVSQVIELPEGSSIVKATVAVPQMSLWHSMAIETYEGGRKLEELSSRGVGWMSGRGGWGWTEDRPALLFIDPDVPPRQVREAAATAFQSAGADPTPTHELPDVRSLVWLFGDPNSAAPQGSVATPALGGNPTDVMILSQLHTISRVEMLPPAELPARWIELSQCDMVVISLEDLRLLARIHLPQLSALRDWLFGGPLLLVFGAGEEFEHLAEIESLLALSPLASASEDPAEHRGWEVPAAADAVELKSAWRAQTGRNTKNKAKAAAAAPVSLSPSVASSSGQPPFLLRPAGQGALVAIGAANPFPGNSGDWAWIFNSVDDNHWRWYQRHGFSLHRTNDGYWEFLIPGVGKAPVFPFLFLVSLFAVVIGPVNYYLLNRARRLYLLLLTVPAGALLITAALFSYAVLADGLGVRLRARSFTLLDQRSGQAAAWSRQSYYAAIVPSQGLLFPEDATIFPIEYEPTRNRPNANENDSLVTWDGGQYLRSGYLSSRTATQCMVQRVTKTEALLKVSESRQAGEPPVLENQLGAALHYVLLRDSRGEFYAAKSLATGAKTTLSKTEPQSAENEFKQLLEAVQPSLPLGSEKGHETAVSLFLPRWGGWMNVDSSASRPEMSAGLLESGIALAATPVSHPPDPRSYVAVMDRPPVVPIGVPRVREEFSLHVIRGKY